MNDPWWLNGLNSQGLSQGDILSPRISGFAENPVKYLSKTPTNKGTKIFWEQCTELQPFKTDNKGLYISRGRVAEVIILSHSCELDKGNRCNQVLVAPIAPLDRIENAQTRENILLQKRRAFFALPNIPTLGANYYADFRAITYIEKKAITTACRLASMSENGIIRLQAQLVAFFTRIEPEALEKAISGNDRA